MKIQITGITAVAADGTESALRRKELYSTLATDRYWRCNAYDDYLCIESGGLRAHVYLLDKANPEFEKTYKDFHNEEQKLFDRINRMHRCLIKSEDRNAWKHCQGNCAVCERERKGERSDNRPVSLDELKDNGADYPSAENIESDYALKERNDILRNALATLSEIDREVIELLYLVDEPLDVTACAELLKVHRNTIANRRNAALERLSNLVPELRDFLG